MTSPQPPGQQQKTGLGKGAIIGIVLGAILLVLVLLAILGALVGKPTDTTKPKAPPATTTAANPPPATSEAPPETPTSPAPSLATSTPAPAPTPTETATPSKPPAGPPPKPTGAARQALLDALRAVHPALVTDPDDAIDNARNQCMTITGNGRAVWAAQQRFSTTDHEVTEAEAERINEALRNTLCP